MAHVFAALIRHGDYQQLVNTPSALQPFDLTDEGKQQSLQAATRIKTILAEEQWQVCPVVDSSHMLRAWHTANIIVNDLQDEITNPLEIKCYEALAERSVGAVANLSIEQIESIIALDPRYSKLPVDWKSNSHFCLPFQGAESLLMTGKRVADHIERQMQTLQQTSTQDTLKIFVGHGAAFRHAAHLLGILDFDEIAQLSMYHASPIYLEYQKDGKWCKIAGEWKLRQSLQEVSDEGV